MNGAKGQTDGVPSATNGAALSDPDLKKVAAARERFAAGADTVQGVRPEILMSWYRCRDEYEVDPRLEKAPAAAEGSAHPIEHDVVFAELGGLATCAAGEIDGLDGLVTVTDCDGRILASWGSRRMVHLAAHSNLAAWFTWSEWASGTNGMGTALENHRPLLVRGPEHWCRGFHPWMCAGVAVRDVVTHDPLAALTISCWKTPLPEAVLPWLGGAAAATEAKLRQRARHTGTLLAAAFADARVTSATPLAAVDPAGNVVLANSDAAVLLGTPADTPAYAPTHRWTSQVPALRQLTLRVLERARQDPGWSGSTRVHVPFLGAPMSVTARSSSSDLPTGPLSRSPGPIPTSTPLVPAPSRTGSSPCGTTDGCSSIRGRSASPRPTMATSGSPATRDGFWPRPEVSTASISNSATRASCGCIDGSSST
jgi:sigma-54 dependent transcriptional regulator, acetoin dehydrogenase operon transcriptional activator AcoR